MLGTAQLLVYCAGPIVSTCDVASGTRVVAGFSEAGLSCTAQIQYYVLHSIPAPTAAVFGCAGASVPACVAQQVSSHPDVG